MNCISIIKSEFANLYSVINALKALGAEIHLTDNAEEIANSKAVIFPGVGSFERVRRELDEKNLTSAIKNFAESGKPFLGICLGMQLLFESSSESENPCEGLSLLQGDVLPIPSEQVSHIPHIGWNSLKLERKHEIYKDIKNLAQVYFVHSYYCSPKNSSDILASTEINNFNFVSMVQKNNIYGMQFHPERSGPIGLKLLKNFLEISNCL